jgi:hypothetical protein
MTKMDPHELSKKIHDKISETQSANSDGKKFLKWDELNHPGFNGKYDTYVEAFVSAVKELVTDPLSITTPSEEEQNEFANILGRTTRQCYYCNNPFNHKNPDRLACSRCIGG